MSRVIFFTVLVALLCNTLIASENPPATGVDKSWWKNRHDRADIFYPHKAHFEVMTKMGDPCLLCHSFYRNKVIQPDNVRSLTTISNEPLQAICHNCHVDELNAPFRCTLCHKEPSAIWPFNHNFDYKRQHAEDARLDNGECQRCHLELSFCTDCHFRRDPTQRREHRIGYQNMHGIDARMNTISCGRCHNGDYCTDCHRSVR